MADRSLPVAPAKKKKTPKEKAAERSLHRERATQELVDTEVTYNTLLGLLITHYVSPLADYKLLTNEQHSCLFPQLLIIKGLSDSFLEELNKRRENWDAKTSKLSDLFETFTPYFRMYQGYVNNHEKSVALLRKLQEREKWIEYCQTVRPLCQRFDLASMLILPIQRLPRYKLLLSEIFKNTAAAHADATDLKTALEKVQNISLEINSRMKEFERRETVKKIERKFDGAIKILEPHRQFVGEGKIWKVCRNKDKLYHFFLFNDILLYASSYGRGYKFHNILPINAAFSCQLLADASAYGKEKHGRIWSIVSEKKSFVVYADTTTDAQRWIDDISTCMQEQSSKTHSSHYKTDSQSAGVWTPDSHAKSCNICNDKFTFVNRRHHCRRCGALVCAKCSKYKLPNAESVMQRACKRCYFQVNISGVPEGDDEKATTPNLSQSASATTPGRREEEDSDDDDFENENAALHSIEYYVDNADESYTTQDIFNKFGHGVGSYVLVPADQDSKNAYYRVQLVVYTQTGFETFNVSLFEKKQAMVWRLESSKKVKKKDFAGINALISHLEKKQKLIFSYAIPRSEVEQKLQKNVSKWDTSSSKLPGTSAVPGTDNASIVPVLYSPKTIEANGLENYPRAKALFDYEAEVHGDLTLRAGDVIYILDKQEEDGWWTGMVDDRQGLFPSTYVEVLDAGKSVPNVFAKRNEPKEGDVLVARYEYGEGGAEELAFAIGDKIVLQAKDESGWWLGKLVKTGVVGWFAPDLVVPLKDEAVGKKKNGSVATKMKKKNGTVGSKKKKVGGSGSKKKSAGGGDSDIVIPYEELKKKKFGKHDVDKSKLEKYLSNQEFAEVFSMSREEFKARPAWKQRNMKKDKGLF